MKKSGFVTLVLSTALVSGCDEPSQSGNPGYTADTNITNNAYVSGRGYYHAPYYGWYEYPYNYYRPGFGYYHGGIYTPRPFDSDIVASHPSVRTGYGVGGGGGGARMGSAASSSTVSRGGFGSIGHGGSSGE
jgi:hypothetical protein